MEILKLKKITPGKRHAWYETDLGFDIRKPLGDYLTELSFWQRLLKYIKKIWKYIIASKQA